MNKSERERERRRRGSNHLIAVAIIFVPVVIYLLIHGEFGLAAIGAVVALVMLTPK